jgi:hypothetical protein
MRFKPLLHTFLSEHLIKHATQTESQRLMAPM